MDKKDNLNKLKNVISSIEKSYGKGSIMMLGKRSEDIDNFEVYSTGSLGLDIALGIGGLPRGRIWGDLGRFGAIWGDLGRIGAI